MGRRSQHTPEELRELILSATRRVVEHDGIAQPSAREIARAIGYAPGTLYNMFRNLDEILLHVEARIFSELDLSLEAATTGKKGRDAIRQFTEAYVSFAFENQNLWNLVIQHHPESTPISPDWYLERAFAPLSRLELIVGRAYTGIDAEDVSRRTRLLWTALHGLIQLGMTNKFGALSRATISSMVQDLTEQFLHGSGAASDRRTDDLRNARTADAAE